MSPQCRRLTEPRNPTTPGDSHGPVLCRREVVRSATVKLTAKFASSSVKDPYQRVHCNEVCVGVPRANQARVVLAMDTLRRRITWWTGGHGYGALRSRPGELATEHDAESDVEDSRGSGRCSLPYSLNGSQTLHSDLKS